MKKAISLLFSLTLLTVLCFAQNTGTKVPENASLVLKYSGIKLSKKLPEKKIESYSYLKKELIKGFKLNKKTTLDDLGIDLKQDAYQYLVTTDSSTSFVTLLAIKNAGKFNKFIKKNKSDTINIESKSGYKLYAFSSNSFIGWDGKIATFVITSYTNHDYYQPIYAAAVDSSKMYESVGTIEPYYDSTIALEEIDTTSSLTNIIEDEDEAYWDNYEDFAIDTAAVIVDSAAYDEDYYYNEAIVDSTIKYNDDDYNYDYNSKDEKTLTIVDSIAPTYNYSYDYGYKEETKEQATAREKFYAEKEKKEKIIKQSLAESIFANTYKKMTTSTILNNASYRRLVDYKADMSIWINENSLFNTFKKSYFYSRYNFDGIPGYNQSANIFFDNDKIRIEEKTFSEDYETERLLKAIYKSKQNASYVNYVKSTDLGFLSSSVNTENILNWYYPLLKKLLNKPYGTEGYSELMDAYVDILEIAIDEKGIANMITGNSLIILHDLKPKEVEYITYDFDEENEYQYKEKIATKTEMSPSFSFIVETKNEKIFNKLLNLPIKLNRDSTYKYSKTGDYYTLRIGKNNVIDSLFFMVKDGNVIVTTSIDLFINNTVSDIDEQTKQAIINKNIVSKIDIKTICEKFSKDISSEKNQQMLSYFKENIKDFELEAGIKNNIIQSSIILNIDGKHNNSLEAIFTTIDGLLKIDSSNKIQ